jgi:OmcA/MtrC family decaheme c-type cytochrome
MHRLNPTTGNPLSPGSVSITINSVVFGAPVDNNVPVTVNFTFAATSSTGADITGDIDLRTKTGAGANDNLAFMSFLLAKMVPGAPGAPGTNGSADEWNGYILTPGASGSGPFRTNRPDGAAGAVFTLVGTLADGEYSYTYPTTAVRVSDGYVDNVLTRAGIQFSIGNPNTLNTATLNLFTTDTYYHLTTLPGSSRRRPAANAILDVVPPVGGGTGAAPTPGVYPNKNDVSTAACNACHDPLAIHGGGRREYKFCQICHNAKLENEGNPAGGGWDNTGLVNLVHKIHGVNPATGDKLHLGAEFEFLGEEVTYPQDIRNCTRCHQGPVAADNTYANWQNRPTRRNCGSCHINVNFATGAGHIGGIQATDALCGLCHDPSYIQGKHATENATPNNPQLPGTLVSFEYGIDNVTVNDNNAATIRFWIKRNGAFLNLGSTTITRPTGFSGGPSFLFAYAMPQDGVATPLDYNNLGARNAAGQLIGYGQPESLSIIGLPVVAHDNVGFSYYTVQRANAFPVDAQMRAVALQGYFTQTNGADVDHDGALDNVGRHTFSVVRPVTGDRVRRVAVESGYTNNNNPTTGIPVGCLECHEIFEGHGGNRVSNAQVCVMCHNPNMSSSARTFTSTPTAPDVNLNGISDIVELYGTNPLLYPEVSNGFKELIHGLHGANKRTTNFVDIRNRVGGVLLQGDEKTFPGDLSHCGKCHLNNLYQNVQATGRFLSTVVITTGADASPADVIAARTNMPNATDLVNTPATSACGHCHDSDPARSHFIAMGGSIRAPRGVATVPVPQLSPEFGAP